jgi:hypothetical protein
MLRRSSPRPEWGSHKTAQGNALGSRGNALGFKGNALKDHVAPNRHGAARDLAHTPNPDRPLSQVHMRKRLRSIHQLRTPLARNDTKVMPLK